MQIFANNRREHKQQETAQSEFSHKLDPFIDQRSPRQKSKISPLVLQFNSEGF